MILARSRKKGASLASCISPVVVGWPMTTSGISSKTTQDRAKAATRVTNSNIRFIVLIFVSSIARTADPGTREHRVEQREGQGGCRGLVARGWARPATGFSSSYYSQVAGVKLTAKPFIFGAVAGPLMTVSVKVTAESFMARDVARHHMTVSQLRSCLPPPPPGCGHRGCGKGA